jgi:rare lipoprotein A
VTNLENGRSVVVRVNDRGPFFETRVIDLSYVAAIKLGIDAHGTGLVEVRALDPAHPEAAPAPASAPARKATLYLQVGAFADPDNARRMLERLRLEGVAKVAIDRVERGGQSLHRVRIGPLASVDESDALEQKLKRLGVTSISVNVD